MTMNEEMYCPKCKTNVIGSDGICTRCDKVAITLPTGKIWDERIVNYRNHNDNLLNVRRIYNQLIKAYPNISPLISKYHARHDAQLLINLERLYLFKEYIVDKLKEDFSLVDIGGNYGMFAYLIKNEYPTSRVTLVDLEKHLDFARSFLYDSNGFKDIKLIPSYDANEIKDIDVVASFTALGEMSKEYFDYYFNCDFFKSNRFFFHKDRIIKNYGYKCNITILDYPHKEYNTLYFNTSPINRFYYKRLKKTYLEPVFTFIGGRK